MRWTFVVLFALAAPSFAAAQPQEQRIGTLTTDAASVEVGARNDGDIVMHAAGLVSSSIICVSKPNDARAWVRATAQAFESTEAGSSGRAAERPGPELRGYECTVQVTRAGDPATYRLQLVRSPGYQRLATTMTLEAEKQLLALISTAADSAANMCSRNPTKECAIAQMSAPGEPYYEFQVERRAWPMEGNPAAKYPPELHQANVEGEVLAQFVVDTLGRAERSTFKVLKSSHELFTTAVWAVIPDLRFRPAEINGRKVRQIVVMPFEFRLTRFQRL